MKINLKNDAATLKRMGTEEETCPVCLRAMEDHDIELIEKEKKHHNTITEYKEMVYEKEMANSSDGMVYIKPNSDDIVD